MGILMFGFWGCLLGFTGGIFLPIFGALVFCGYILYDTHRVVVASMSVSCCHNIVLSSSQHAFKNLAPLQPGTL